MQLTYMKERIYKLNNFSEICPLNKGLKVL